MALSDAQKSTIRRYLGYPDGNRLFHQDLEGAMDALSGEGETTVGTILTNLGTIEATLQSSWGRQKVIRAEEVTLAGRDEIEALRSEGRRLAYDLASILGVKALRTPFSSGGGGSGVALRGA